MTRRILLTLLVGAAMTAAVSAFAPAPIFKEPPRPAVPAIEQAMQGNWARFASTKGRGKVGRQTLIRIRDKTWTTLSKGPRGEVRVGATYEILLDTSHNPAVLDLKFPTSSVAMKGIVKIEGDHLIFCYARTDSDDERPKAFPDRQTPNGLRVLTMTLTRIESSAPSP
jgi:uncharacterized protein (TIGR03067 family)